MGKKHYSDEQRRKIIEMNNQRLPRVEIAKKIGKNLRSLNQYCHFNGIKQLPKFSDDKKAIAVEMRKQGHTIKEIATATGFSIWTIQNYLKTKGLSSKKYLKNSWSEQKIEELAKAILSSNNLQEVSQKINKTESSIINEIYLLWGTTIMVKLKEIIKDEMD